LEAIALFVPPLPPIFELLVGPENLDLRPRTLVDAVIARVFLGETQAAHFSPAGLSKPEFACLDALGLLDAVHGVEEFPARGFANARENTQAANPYQAL